MNQQDHTVSGFADSRAAFNRNLQGNRLLHMAGACSAVVYVLIGELNGSGAGIGLWPFLVLSLLLSLTVVMLYWVYTRNSATVPHSLRSWSVAMPDTAVIVFWALLFRIIGICYDPIMEDDYYRYLWDGYLFWQQGTPYGVAPSDYFGDPSVADAFQPILSGINYPDTPTIYGPVLQYSFLLAHAFFPGQVLGLQLLYSAADILLILVLAKMSSRPALLLYAWCPLLIKETAFTAHPDILGVLLLMASVLALQQQRLSSAALLLALSLGAKVFAVLLAPLILWRCRPRHWLLFIVTMVALYAPFWWKAGSDAAGLFAFANDWHFNASVHALLTYWNHQWAAAGFEYHHWLPKALTALLFCSFYAWYAWRYLGHGLKTGEYGVPRGDWIFGVFFLLAPVVNAWYLVWLLAFATIYPSRWAWVAAMALLLSYVTGGALDTATLELYQQPLWARILEYGVILGALLLDLRDWRNRTNRKNRKNRSIASAAPMAQRHNTTNTAAETHVSAALEQKSNS